jgi:hypothetical protein
VDIDLVVELATGGRSSRCIFSVPAIEVSLLVIFMAGRITQTWEEEAVPASGEAATFGKVIAWNDYYLYHELAASDRSTASLAIIIL